MPEPKQTVSENEHKQWVNVKRKGVPEVIQTPIILRESRENFVSAARLCHFWYLKCQELMDLFVCKARPPPSSLKREQFPSDVLQCVFVLGRKIVEDGPERVSKNMKVKVTAE